MKKFLFVAAIAALMTACGEKFDKVKLTDDLVVVNVRDAEPKLYGVQDLNGKEILPMKFSAITLENDLLLTENNEGQKLFNQQGSLLFGSADDLNKDGAFWVDPKPGAIRYYNPENDVIIGPYAKILKTPGQFVVYKDSILAGIVSFGGKELVEPNYDELYVVQDDKGTTVYIVFDKQAGWYQSYGVDGKAIRSYTKKQFKRLRKGIKDEWSHGFLVKEL